MLLYKAEIEAGLSEKIAKGSVTTASLIRAADPTEIQREKVNKLLKAIGTNLEQPDLYYFASILVTSGWNKNEDVWTKEEIWKARATAEDKQINYMHNEKDIIGHMTASFAINDKNEALASDIIIDDLPARFHVATAGVVYKKWEDKDLAKRMEDILTSISKGELYVSVEAIFSDFDYACIEDEKEYVVTRGAETAFLTKFLKVYGGSGVYNNIKVGRLLRNITFSGKAVVDRPANPYSVIFNDVIPFTAKSSFQLKKENKVMAEIQELKVSADPEVAVLKDQVTKLNLSIEAMVKAQVEAKTKAELDAKVALDNEIKGLKADIVKRDEQIAQLTKDVTTAKEANVNDELNKKLADAEKAAKAAQDELDKVKGDSKKAARVAKLVSLGHANEAAVALEVKLNALNDEAFEAVIASMKPIEKEDKEDDLIDFTQATQTGKKDPVGGSNTKELEATFADFGKAFAGILKTTPKK